MVRIAVLDDYQGVALELADWSVLPPDAKVEVFSDHLEDQGAVAERLREFEVVVAMRERTPFPRALLERLPRLALLVTTANQNAAIDVEAARELGVVVSGTGGTVSLAYATSELTWGLILALARQIPGEDRAVREGGWQVSMGQGLHGKTLGNHRSRQPRYEGGERRQGLRDGARGVEPEPHRGARDRRGRLPARQGRAARALRRRDDPPQAERAHPRADRRGGAGADEADGVPGQHLARADRRRACAGRGARGRHDRGRRPRYLSTASRCRSTTPCGGSRTPCSRPTSAT